MVLVLVNAGSCVCLQELKDVWMFNFTGMQLYSFKVMEATEIMMEELLKDICLLQEDVGLQECVSAALVHFPLALDHNLPRKHC